MSFLDRVRARAAGNEIDRIGICESCGNLAQAGEALGCEAHDKLIMPEYPPYHLPANLKCPDWIQREEGARTQ